MFECGTEVVILSSSLTKSGVKRGSIGHMILNRDKIYKNIYGGIYAKTIDILVTRFGFEKTRRSEKKSIITIFPFGIIGKLVGRGISDDKIAAEIVKCLKNEDFTSPQWMELRRELDLPSNTAICLVVPAPMRSVSLYKNSVVFNRWVTAHALNPNMYNVFSQFKSENKIENIVNNTYLSKFKRMCGDKDYRISFLRTIRNEKNEDTAQTMRKTMVETIVKIKTIFDCSSHDFVLEHLEHQIVTDHFTMGPEELMRPIFIRELGEHLFIPVIMDKKIRLFRSNKHILKNTFMKNTLKGMKGVIEEINKIAYQTVNNQ